MTAFPKWIQRLFCLCFVLCFLAIAVMNSAGLGVLLIAAAVLIPKKISIPHFLPLLLVVSAIVHVAAVFLVNPEPIQDFATMYHAAQQAAEGDFSFQHTQYFFIWAYQTGFVLWEALLLKVFGHMTAIKLVHALMLSGINGLLYLWARRFTDERAAQTAALLYLVTLFPTVLNCLLTNQVASAFFLLLGIYLLTDGNNAFSVPRAIGAGILLSIGNILRPEAIVILAGLAGTAIFILIMKRSVRQHKRMLSGIVLAVIVYAVCNAGASWAVSAGGINQYGLSNNWTSWKFIVGLNHETGGMYSADDRALFDDAHQIDTTEQQAEATAAAENQLIRSRILVSPGKLLSLMKEKVYHLWVQSGLSFPMGYFNNPEVSVHGIPGPRFYQNCVTLDRTVFGLAGLFALLGMLSLLRRKPETLTFSAVLAPMTVMACFAVFLLIEVQPRYVFLPQIFLYITAAMGITPLFSLLRESRGKE